METICPPSLAEEWDNVGLLLGSRSAKIDISFTDAAGNTAKASHTVMQKS